MIEKKCVQCGKPVIIKKNSDYRLKREGWKFFCSRECSFKYHVGEKSTLSHRPLVYTTRTCPVCGKSFEIVKHIRKTCCCKEHGIMLMAMIKFCKSNGIDCNIPYNEYLKIRAEIEANRKSCKNVYRQTNINIEYSKNKKEYMKEYYRQHRAEIYEKTRLRVLKNPLIRLKDDIRKAINSSIKAKKFIGKRYDLEKIIGCDIDSFLSHLSSQFKERMSFDNYGEWHIDHIIPLYSAKTKEEVFALCHYKNLQPLWAYENSSKGYKILKADNIQAQP